MAKYVERDMKSHRAPRKRSGGAQQCPLGFVQYDSKSAAVKASPVARADRCGQCRKWHAVPGKGKR
jgi:hypothetical protein